MKIAKEVKTFIKNCLLNACMLNMTVNAVPSSVPSSQEKALAPMDMKTATQSQAGSDGGGGGVPPQASMKRARFLINDILSSAASAAAVAQHHHSHHHLLSTNQLNHLSHLTSHPLHHQFLGAGHLHVNHGHHHHHMVDDDRDEKDDVDDEEPDVLSDDMPDRNYSPQGHRPGPGQGGPGGVVGDLPKDLSFHRRSTCGDSSDYDDSESIKGSQTIKLFSSS